MPTFSRSTHGSGRKTVHVRLEAPSREIFEADVFADETFGELAKEFYEFLNSSEDAREASVYLVDPVTSHIVSTLDENATLKAAGISDGGQLRFAAESAAFDVEITAKKALKVSLPFPTKLTVSQFAWYSHDFLSASDLMYSLFSILLSENQWAIGALERLLNEDSHRLTESKIIHQLLKISGGQSLELQKAQYGSPLSFVFDGLWKPLELFKDTIIELKRAPHIRKMDEHDERMAQIEEQKGKIALVQSYLDLANSGNIKLSKETKTKLVMAVLPQVEALDAVLLISSRESDRKRLKSSAQNHHFP